ncbi:hypothetical protein CRE_29312 [Caenorhabditis remanei]|uniref:Uncharacterized protein n=1 Tax=Caenorhabditis remanei TaxID=31234 RepID=E3MY30_CAERE|nr:hypothetical protein CRE_29312 [Caenorhabditis remanei]
MSPISFISLLFLSHFFAGKTILATPIAGIVCSEDLKEKPSDSLVKFVDEEVVKIAKACLSNRDEEEITGNILKYGMAQFLNPYSLMDAMYVIGLTELRSVLGLPLSVPWKQGTKPTADELAAASTIEEYYKLKEPYSSEHGNSKFLLEKHLPPAIKFLDKRFPAIRIMYRRHLEESACIVDKKGVIGREKIDYMIEEYWNIIAPISEAMLGIMFHMNDCRFERTNWYHRRQFLRQ